MQPGIEHGLLSQFDYAHSLEWLETNGLGGWASSTVSGAHSRRYHGMLIAAGPSMTDRVVLVSKLEEAIVSGKERYELSCNQYPGALFPAGYQHLVRFGRDLFPVFSYRMGEIGIRKTIAAVQGENTTLILYEVIHAPEAFAFELRPFYAARNIHSLSQANESMNGQFVFSNGILRLKNYERTPEVFISVPGSSFREDQHWYYHVSYSVEQRRGMDFNEDLYSHGVFSLSLKEGSKLGILISAQEPYRRNAFALFAKEEKRRRALTTEVDNDHQRRLILAADQFIVSGPKGSKSIIAGYPWLTEGGRDTMLALTGLCIATGRVKDARKILRRFSGLISEGMIPHRFSEGNGVPEYSAIDATLWYFVALYNYYVFTRDVRFIRSLLPLLAETIEWHYKGTRHGIRVDEDGLLTGGSLGTQLTWMDARTGNQPVTPRPGKAVEVNALWYNALCIMEFLNAEAGRARNSVPYRTRSATVMQNFNTVFWNESGGYLYDYVDGDYSNANIRPNQIYSIALPFPLLPKSRAERVLKVIEKHLLTPRGLRTLDPANHEYKPAYEGGIWSRDAAYHQGTVWSFLLGPYVDAVVLLRGAKGRRDANHILVNFLAHLDEACVGTVSELFEAEAPHAARGCIAHARGVAEMLRVSVDHGLLHAKEDAGSRSPIALPFGTEAH